MAEVHMRFYAGRGVDLRAKTGIFVPVANWNAAEGRCSISRRYETPANAFARDAQTKLDTLAAKVTQEYARAGGKVGKEWLQSICDGTADERSVTDLIDAYCDAKHVSAGTRKRFHTTRNHIERFEQHKRLRLYTRTLSVAELQAFVLFLHDVEHMSANSYSVTLRNLRAVVYWAGKPTPNPFDTFTMPQEVYGDPTFLTREERDAIAEYDGLSASKKVQRDIFIFQCHTGCRVSDLYNLTSRNIKDGWLVYSPIKTRNQTTKSVEIPLTPTAQAIVDRYKGVDMRGRLFPFISTIKYNDAIRYVLRKVGITRPVIVRDPQTGDSKPVRLCDVASSHLARRTFTQIAYAATADKRLVSSMTGHAENSRAFNRYSEVTRDMKKKVLDVLE